MEPSRLRVVVLLLVTSCGLSCAVAGRAEVPPDRRLPAAAAAARSAQPEPALTAAEAKPLPAPQPPAQAVAAPLPGAAVPVTADALPDIRLDSQAPALTETLERALDMLAEARAENARLKETIASLQGDLASKDAAVRDLSRQLTESEGRIQQFEADMEKWKQDVLGFRDEMRAYEEAEIQVLQEVAVLLRGFKKERDAQ